jgi:hypothetical protein
MSAGRTFALCVCLSELNLSLVPGIVISLKVLHGELPQVREENPLLFKNISLTKKLGFSDVIMPGDVRSVQQVS